MGYGLSQAFLRFQQKVSEFYNLYFSNTNTIPPTATSSRNQKLKLVSDASVIPDDVIFLHILPKLPPKTIVKLKSVARHWKTFISSVEFGNIVSSLSPKSVLTLESNLTSFVAFDYNDNNNLVTKEFGKQFYRYDTLCSSCNGLVFLVSCIENINNNVLPHPNNLHLLDFTYVVYNPVLGVDHFIEIPDADDHILSHENFKDNSNYNFGFGYVSSLDDFFIVAIDFPLNFEMDFYVYSLRHQRWTINYEIIELEEDALPLRFQDPWFLHTGTLVKETLYWGMAQGKDIQFIFAYNLGAQNIYALIGLPNRDFGESGAIRHDSAFSLCCLDNSLCAWASYSTNYFKMWMFGEDRESELGYSWVCLFSFAPDFLIRNFFGFNESGQTLVHIDDELFLANFNCRPPLISDAVLDDIWSAVDYVPTLVSVPNIAAV